MDDLKKAAQIEYAYKLKNEKYHFFEPNGKGEEFINAIGSGKYFITFISAANGVGKTATAINSLAHLMFESKNKFFQTPLWKNWPYPKRGRIVSDPTNVKQGIVPALKEWFPKGRYTAKKGRRDYESEWVTDTGWSFDIMTYDQDPKEFEGVTLGWVWMDEPPPQVIYKANISRLRKGGMMFITATPLKGSAWMYDSLVCTRHEPGREVCYIEADVESACSTHGVRGHLDHDHIVRMISEYDEQDKQARIYGKFQHLAGLVFKQFRRNVHVIKPFKLDRDKWSVYHALDTHPRNPDAGLWVAVNKDGKKIVCSELYENGTTSELAQRIKERDYEYNVVQRLLEPAAFIEDQHTEQSLAILLENLGLYYEKGSKRRSDALQRIMDAFDFEKKGDAFLKEPELYIFDNCQRTIWELEHYVWDEWNGRTGDNKMPKETPIDKNDHLIECMGRIMLAEPRFQEYNFQGESAIIMETDSLDPY